MVNITNVGKVLGTDRIEKLSTESLGNSYRGFIDACIKEAVTQMHSDGCSTKEISDYIGLKKSIIEGMLSA